MRILVVAAHSDDPVIGMGGSIKKLSKEGNEILVLSVCGDRISGFKSAMGFLGAQSEAFDYSYGNIDESSLRKEVEDVVEKFTPDLVFTHWNKEILHDHEVVSHVVYGIARKYDVNLLMYEIPASSLEFSFNVAVDITEYYEFRKEAIEMMREAFDGKVFEEEIMPSIVYPPAFRGIQVGVKYAEVFNLRGSRRPLSPYRWALWASSGFLKEV